MQGAVPVDTALENPYNKTEEIEGKYIHACEE